MQRSTVHVWLKHTEKDTSTDDNTLSLVNQMLKDDLLIGISDLSYSHTAERNDFYLTHETVTAENV